MTHSTLSVFTPLSVAYRYRDPTVVSRQGSRFLASIKIGTTSSIISLSIKSKKYIFNLQDESTSWTSS